MTKKKVKSDDDSSAPVVDLKTLIHQHSMFFDKLVELIPAKFYLPADENKPWFQGLSKSQKALAKKETKANLKKARRDRLDPEKSSTTTLDLLKQNLEKERKENESDSDDNDNDNDEDDLAENKAVLSSLDEDNNRSVTYEELRQRLRRKIEECRDDRNVGCSKREQKRNERVAHQPKRKRDDESKEKVPKPGGSLSRDAVEASNELSFSHVKLDEHGKKKKRKLSKQQELERAKELAEAKKDPSAAKKHSWGAATSRAAGIKVHDDPKLLSKSIQKQKRRQQKNAQKWKERVQHTNKMKADRQKKRTGNIVKKKDEKKKRKIEKREKKLMRPGFEGRREGFVNEGTA